MTNPQVTCTVIRFEPEVPDGYPFGIIGRFIIGEHDMIVQWNESQQNSYNMCEVIVMYAMASERRTYYFSRMQLCSSLTQYATMSMCGYYPLGSPLQQTRLNVPIETDVIDQNGLYLMCFNASQATYNELYEIAILDKWNYGGLLLTAVIKYSQSTNKITFFILGIDPSHGQANVGTFLRITCPNLTSVEARVTIATQIESHLREVITYRMANHKLIGSSPFNNALQKELRKPRLSIVGMR